jgi:uncharacterized protein with PQ loop repeat
MFVYLAYAILATVTASLCLLIELLKPSIITNTIEGVFRSPVL